MYQYRGGDGNHTYGTSDPVINQFNIPQQDEVDKSQKSYFGLIFSQLLKLS